jgi:hypothetical protein
MNSNIYTYLLANPQKISSDHLSELDLVLEKYPYFQSARALQLKGYKNSNSFLYNDALKQTAAYTTDRNILFEYITSEHFIQDEISELIQQHDDSVREINVIPEDLSEQVSMEIEKQLKEEIKKAEAILNPELFSRKVESIKKITEERQEAKRTLGVGTPLDFKKEDSHSFNEWLKLTTATPIQRESKKPSEKEKKEYNLKLIDKFIQENPKLQIKEKTPARDIKKELSTENLAAPFTETPNSLMTETLAKVYLQQKNYKKALQAYHILILKYPEKSGFFADQIRAIEKLINTDEI